MYTVHQLVYVFFEKLDAKRTIEHVRTSILDIQTEKSSWRYVCSH